MKKVTLKSLKQYEQIKDIKILEGANLVNTVLMELYLNLRPWITYQLLLQQ